MHRLNDLVCQLEERERNMDATLQSTNKEASLKQQVLELHKKKVWEGVCVGHVWLVVGGRCGGTCRYGVVVGGGREGVPARADSLYFLGANSCS